MAKVVFREQMVVVRKRRNLSQKEVAKRAGIDPSIMSRMETGERKINIEQAAALAAAVEEPICVLTGQAHDQLPASSPWLDRFLAATTEVQHCALCIFEAFLEELRTRATPLNEGQSC